MSLDNFFDNGLHYLGKNQTDVIALNIGAMDGVLFDEMIGYTIMYGYKVLYVEPIPYLYEKLIKNVPTEKSIFENSAISDYNGEIDMITIDKKVIDDGLVHNCFYGMSAVFPPKNGLGSEFDKPTVDKYGKKIKVNCITFNNLITKHNLNSFDIVKIDAEGHDYVIFKQIDLDKYKPKIIRLEWINLQDDEKEKIIEKFKKYNYIYEINSQDIVGITYDLYHKLSKENYTDEVKITKDNKITLVTGLWDIGRDKLKDGWSRNYNHYLNKLEELLKIDCNLIIFGDNELWEFVRQRRNQDNTQFITRNIDWFKNQFYDKIQEIRNNPKWYNQVGWLKDSTQGQLDMYNPLVMSKMFLLHDAKILDRFDSEYLFWIDAGITNTIHLGYFTHDKILDKLPNLINNFHFVCFPYETTTEIHGFEINEMNKICKKNVNRVARGGFFGGKKEIISDMNSIYYHLLDDTLNNGLMGTEESIFTIMTYLHPNKITYSMIGGDGLMWKFFEEVKDNTLVLLNEKPKFEKTDISKVGLYVITFNSPKQFETLIKSMLEYDSDFITKPKKFLLDNSTDLSTTSRYIELCEQYGFEHIKKDNLGIMGGRIFVAEHFNETDLDYYFWFEDDMFFYPKKEVCKNGFNRYVEGLYNKSLEIIQKENFDFLKLNYTEFYGDNGTQWSWYNVPQDFRQKHWPNNSKLPQIGTDPNSPKTEFKNIKSYKGIPYVDGEVYISNWPIVLNKEGNYKCYLETRFQSPFEQTTMSYCYQETIKGKIKPGLLLITPTEHNRFEHYSAELRREN